MTVMQIVQQLFGSMGITMEIFFVTLITSLILGLGLALIRMSKNPILSVIAKFYISLDGEIPSRKEVLAVNGVGNETADSILLFAYKQKQFKVDAYTKRIFSYLGYFDEKEKYMNIKKLFEDSFNGDVNAYQEYHALIVEHGKNYYLKKPYGIEDKILSEFKI